MMYMRGRGALDEDAGNEHTWSCENRTTCSVAWAWAEAVVRPGATKVRGRLRWQRAAVSSVCAAQVENTIIIMCCDGRLLVQ